MASAVSHASRSRESLTWSCGRRPARDGLERGMATLHGPRRWFFDVWSLFYDLPWVQRVVYRGPQDAVVARLAARRPKRVLDLGCGTGQLAARVRRELRGTRVVGCDFSNGMLHHARARDRIPGWVQGDACRLPF